jgi:hypothetical protein
MPMNWGETKNREGKTTATEKHREEKNKRENLFIFIFKKRMS